MTPVDYEYYSRYFHQKGKTNENITLGMGNDTDIQIRAAKTPPTITQNGNTLATLTKNYEKVEIITQDGKQVIAKLVP